MRILLNVAKFCTYAKFVLIKFNYSQQLTLRPSAADYVFRSIYSFLHNLNRPDFTGADELSWFLDV